MNDKNPIKFDGGDDDIEISDRPEYSELFHQGIKMLAIFNNESEFNIEIINSLTINEVHGAFVINLSLLVRKGKQ